LQFIGSNNGKKPGTAFANNSAKFLACHPFLVIHVRRLCFSQLAFDTQYQCLCESLYVASNRLLLRLVVGKRPISKIGLIVECLNVPKILPG